MYKKLTEEKGETVADPIGKNIQHNATKYRNGRNNVNWNKIYYLKSDG